VEFYAPSWSGSNSHRGRIQAAKDLAAHIDLVAAKHPGVPHFIIGHSHGGNVALYALRYATKTDPVLGVCCLSTPFFKSFVRKGSPKQAVVRVLVGALAVSALISNWIYPMRLLGDPHGNVKSSVWLVMAAVVVLPSLLGLGVVARRIFPEYFSKLEKSWALRGLARLSRSVENRETLGMEILIVRTPKDEASLWLEVCLLANLCVRYLGSPLQRASDAFVKAHNSVRDQKISWWGLFRQAILIGGVVWLIAWNYLLRRGALSIRDVVTLSVGAFVLGVAVPFILAFSILSVGLLLAFVTVPFRLIGGFSYLGFGWDLPPFSAFLDLSVESSPLGLHKVLLLPFRRARGLWHSEAYLRQETFDAIRLWMNDREKAFESK
jgi:hypothetical protein